ncbi:leucine-rich repeat-containing protein 74B isoform 1-T1 [Alca torda]
MAAARRGRRRQPGRREPVPGCVPGLRCDSSTWPLAAQTGPRAQPAAPWPGPAGERWQWQHHRPREGHPPQGVRGVQTPPTPCHHAALWSLARTRNQCRHPKLGTVSFVFPTKENVVVTPLSVRATQLLCQEHVEDPFLPAWLAVQTPGAKALALFLMVDTSVLTLDLSDNWLQGEGAAAVAEMLKENCYISAVDVSDNKLGVEGAKAFSTMLLENTTLVSLQLSGNEFNDYAAKYLADAITANSKVEILDLSYNLFGDKAGEILGMAIAENIGLKEFKISWNHFHSQGAAALAKGLGANIFLKVLDVSYNGFGNCGAAALGEALRVNNVLEELNVRNNRISAEGALHIAAGLKENKTLKKLNMTRNPMQSEGCCGVLKALQANSGTGIEILDLPDIPVDKELAELCDAVKILFPNLLLRHGGNTKLQRKSQLKAELRTLPKLDF